MAETIFTRALIQAAEMHGSTQAVASLLRVPENTLLRWMAGRAMMPVKAFRTLIELLKTMDAHPIDAANATPGGIFQFSHRGHSAFCSGCKGTQFALHAPPPLRYRSTLTCITCNRDVLLADLLAHFADHYGRVASRRNSSAPTSRPNRGRGRSGDSSPSH